MLKKKTCPSNNSQKNSPVILVKSKRYLFSSFFICFLWITVTSVTSQKKALHLPPNRIQLAKISNFSWVNDLHEAPWCMSASIQTTNLPGSHSSHVSSRVSPTRSPWHHGSWWSPGSDPQRSSPHNNLGRAPRCPCSCPSKLVLDDCTRHGFHMDLRYSTRLYCRFWQVSFCHQVAHLTLGLKRDPIFSNSRWAMAQSHSKISQHE